MTCGFDVFVHDVIAAMTTLPSASSYPSTGTRRWSCSATATGARSGSVSRVPSPVVGSLAGNVSATSLS
jgi:hypothetical protein